MEPETLTRGASFGGTPFLCHVNLQAGEHGFFAPHHVVCLPRVPQQVYFGIWSERALA